MTTMIARAIAAAAIMAVWGFAMTAGIAAKCGHGGVVDLEAGAATAAILFAVTAAMTFAAERHDRADGARK